MRARLFLSRLRLALVVSVILGGPAFWLSAQEQQSSPQPAPEAITMSGMGSLVPTLVAVGWEHCFLDIRQNLGLSDQQSQQLYSIRQRFVADRDGLEKELANVQLDLYRKLESDRVDAATLGPDLKKIAELKAAISAAHFKAVLEAIYVLNHRQHLDAQNWLKLRLEMLRHELPSTSINTARFRPARRETGRRSPWSSFTPQQLYWRKW